MAATVVRQIPEARVPGKPLGRHVEHDPASRAYAAHVAAARQLLAVQHARHGGLFDQSKPVDLGSCTGNALAGAVNCDPFYNARPHAHQQHTLHERDAVALYAKATALDDIPGTYPPDDTGSSGLAVCKAGVQLGYIKAYHHAFSMDQALQALQLTPVITGVDWYEGFDMPHPNTGLVAISGQPRGGHEFLVRQYLPQHTNSVLDDIVGADNSWGLQWGLHGRFFFTVRTWQALLDAQGDVTVPQA